MLIFMIINKQCRLSQFREIHVKFLGGNSKYTDAVKRYAPEWQSVMGLGFKFVFDDHEDAHIQISFNDKNTHESLVGPCRRKINSPFPGTMTLGFTENTSEETMRAIILHEFGHAVGLEHEHEHPDCPIVWDKEAVYAYYAKNFPDWSREKIEENLFKKLDKNDPNYLFYEYDKNSVMHYFVNEEWTVGNFVVPYNTKLSDLDKQNWQKYITGISLLPDPSDRCAGVICRPEL